MIFGALWVLFCDSLDISIPVGIRECNFRCHRSGGKNHVEDRFALAYASMTSFAPWRKVAVLEIDS